MDSTEEDVVTVDPDMDVTTYFDDVSDPHHVPDGRGEVQLGETEDGESGGGENNQPLPDDKVDVVRMQTHVENKMTEALIHQC